MINTTNPVAICIQRECNCLIPGGGESYITTTRDLGSKLLLIWAADPPPRISRRFPPGDAPLRPGTRSSRNCCPPALPYHSFQGTCSPRDPPCHRRSTLSYSSLYEEDPVTHMLLLLSSQFGVVVSSVSASRPVFRTVGKIYGLRSGRRCWYRCGWK